MTNLIYVKFNYHQLIFTPFLKPEEHVSHRHQLLYDDKCFLFNSSLIFFNNHKNFFKKFARLVIHRTNPLHSNINFIFETTMNRSVLQHSCSFIHFTCETCLDGWYTCYCGCWPLLNVFETQRWPTLSIYRFVDSIEYFCKTVSLAFV